MKACPAARRILCELFRNNRNGTFTEMAATAGVAVAAFVKGVACADYDNDGRPDLYLSDQGQAQLALPQRRSAGGRQRMEIHRKAATAPACRGRWRVFPPGSSTTTTTAGRTSS